jgi:hypothetical protein
MNAILFSGDHYDAAGGALDNNRFFNTVEEAKAFWVTGWNNRNENNRVHEGFPIGDWAHVAVMGVDRLVVVVEWDTWQSFGQKPSVWQGRWSDEPVASVEASVNVVGPQDDP